MGQATTTTDHREIRAWIEERGGRPSRVAGTGSDSDRDAGMLRVDFDEPEESLEPIGWETFFSTFESNDLAFLHQDRTDEGKTSRFFKFVQRDQRR